MGTRIVQVDAFTNQAFAGNPAGVCILPKAPSDAWMQNVAREMNVAETAFLVPNDDSYHLRWFTPAVEVKLCGHATLASAHVLWQDAYLAVGKQARFSTLSGTLTADQRGDWIEMDFPATREERADAPPGLLEALGVKSAYVGRSKFDYLVQVDSEEIVRGLNPDHTVLKKLPVRGVIVTARSSAPDFDFVSRFFAPGSGIDEDPATGSAHCCLGPFWTKHLGKSEFTAFQASPRGAVLRVRVDGERVKLIGQAVTVLRGELAA
jgi:PhzF family phenazine biosynthesis protein